MAQDPTSTDDPDSADSDQKPHLRVVGSDDIDAAAGETSAGETSAGQTSAGQTSVDPPEGNGRKESTGDDVGDQAAPERRSGADRRTERRPVGADSNDVGGSPGAEGDPGAVPAGNPDGAAGAEGADATEGTAEPSEATKRSRRRQKASKARSERDGQERNHPEPSTQDPLIAARERLAEADPESTYKSLLSLVRDDHSDVLTTLDYTPGLQFHDPRCVKMDPNPSGLETIDLYAHAAFPDFDRILAEPFADPRNDHLYNSLRMLLFHENQNVALVTNHGQIIDIALVIGAMLLSVCSHERTFGALGARVELDDLADRTNVMVSRMVATQAAFGVPALQVLQIGARTFLSIPQTASRRRARLDADVARANNVVMRHELEAQLAKGGQILAMAASGSQDLSLAGGLMNRARQAWFKRRGEEPPEEPTLHLQPLYDGTIRLMSSCDYVLPVAVSVDPAKPCCVLGELTKLTEDDDCHRVMDWIAQAHQDVTGVPTVYHWHEDDLLTQVRS
ncbi:MAG: hypothetical protein ACK5O2_12500, partial [Microthrixaceae bacterium]